MHLRLLLLVSLAVTTTACGDRDLRRDHAGAVPFVLRPAEVHDVRPDPDDPLRLLTAKITELPPDGVGGGDRFSFVVEVTNPTDQLLPLDPCPVYGVSLGNDGHATHFQSHLPCSELGGGLAPRSSRRIVVEMRAPDTNPGTGDTLTWRLARSGVVASTPLEEGARFPTPRQIQGTAGLAALATALLLAWRLRS